MQIVNGWRGDWPPPGAAVDLERDDLPHPDCGFEWWHFHCHLTTSSGAEHGFIVMFTRSHLTRAHGARLPGHLLRWARSDCDNTSYTSGSWLDSGALAGHRAVIADDVVMDPHVRTALIEALAEGVPFSPDRLLPAEARTATDRLDLNYGEVGTLRKAADGSYQITVLADDERYELTFVPGKPPIRQSRDGRLRGRLKDDGDATYTYLTPRGDLRGTVVGQGGESETVSGTGWYEHGFGGDRFRLGDGQRVPDRQWNQVSIQLDNGWDITAWSLEHVDISTQTSTPQCTQAVGSAPCGEQRCSTAELTGTHRWISMSTMNSYPTRWEISAPELDLRVIVHACFPEQEIGSMIVGPGTLQACAVVRGTMAGQPVSGRAFIQVAPAQRVGDFEEFLTRADPITRREINRLYPDKPSRSLTRDLLGDDEASVDGISDQQLHEAMIEPIRYMVDGASKGLRSYVTCAVIESIGVRSTPYAPLMAVAELSHSANLVIDDVEDNSTTRRGRPSAHLVYGTAHAINSGTAAYFCFGRIADEVVGDDPVLRLRAFESLVHFMGVAHIGQAIDITGHTAAMDAAVASGDPSVLLGRIRSGHRLKSGVPVAGLAEIGAVITRASTDQVAAMGEYFKAVGTAFQISDDLLDLYGATCLTSADLDHLPKHSGEDLRAGKVTMPLAHAVALLPRSRMAELWHEVRGGCDLPTAREVAGVIVDCGAADVCYREAGSLVDEGWRKLDALLPNSHAKATVRAMGRYSALREPRILPTRVGTPMPHAAVGTNEHRGA